MNRHPSLRPELERPVYPDGPMRNGITSRLSRERSQWFFVALEGLLPKTETAYLDAGVRLGMHLHCAWTAADFTIDDLIEHKPGSTFIDKVAVIEGNTPLLPQALCSACPIIIKERAKYDPEKFAAHVNKRLAEVRAKAIERRTAR